jgi:cytochrome P450
MLHPLLLFFFLYVSYRVIYSHLRQRRLKALHASLPPRRRSYLPLGLDILIEGAVLNYNDKGLLWFTNTFRDYGNSHNPYNVVIPLGQRSLLLTADPENIKAMLASQSKDFGKGPNIYAAFKALMGSTGVFTTDGEMWHNARSLLRPQFSRKRINDVEKLFETYSQALIRLMEGEYAGQTVNTSHLFFRFTLDVTTNYLFAQPAGSLQHEKIEVGKAFDKVQYMVTLRARLASLYWLAPMWLIKKEVRTINDFCGEFIEMALALTPEELEKAASGTSASFLHKLALYTQDRTVLRDQLMNILVAGRDTTACMLSWLFYEFSLNPDIIKKLRQEISQTVETRPPTYEELRGMRYLQVNQTRISAWRTVTDCVQHCISEIFRKYPAISFNVRYVLQDTTLPSGGGPNGNGPIAMLRGDSIAYSPLALQQREDIYPPVSKDFPPIDQYAPERWENWYPTPWT